MSSFLLVAVFFGGLCVGLLFLVFSKAESDVEAAKTRSEDLRHLVNLYVTLNYRLLPALRQYIDGTPDLDNKAPALIHEGWSKCSNPGVTKIAGYLYGMRFELLSPSRPETCSVAEMWHQPLKRLEKQCLDCLCHSSEDDYWHDEYKRICEFSEYLAGKL